MYPSRDARREHGGPGVGARPKPRSQSVMRAGPVRQLQEKVIGGPNCYNCSGLCCALPRAFIEEAFALGATDLSPKVSL